MAINDRGILSALASCLEPSSRQQAASPEQALIAASVPAHRPNRGSRSPERWFAVPASLQLKEAVGVGDQHEAIP